jgi:hypothetical protein
MFVGNNLFITTDVIQTNRVHLPQGIETETVPLYYEGVLMDIDNEFLYLGDGKEIQSAIKRRHILHIELKENKDLYTQILESIPSPGEDDFN